MGGKVLAESEVGKGSTFSVTFKVMCKISASGQSSKSDVENLSARNLSGSLEVFAQNLDNISRQKSRKLEVEHIFDQSFLPNKPRMLLVNDEIFLQEAYEMQLEDQFNVVIAENGLQALQLVTSEA